MKISLITLLSLSFCLCSCSHGKNKEDARLRFEKMWIRSTLKEENYGFRRSERTSPLVDGDTIYQGNAVDGVSAYKTDSGFQKWRFDIRNGLESGLASDDRHLFFGASDGNFYGLNKITGHIAWSFPTRVENLGPPLVHSGTVFFISGNNVLYALDAHTGKQLWNYNRGEVSSLSIRGAPRPTLYKNILYAGFSDGYLVAVNANDGSLLWERKLAVTSKFFDVDSTPVVDDEFIWTSSYDGALYCLSRVDGQVHWRLDDGASVPVDIEGDTLYYGSLTRNVYSLNKKTGHENWKITLEDKEGIPTQPVVLKDLILIGSSDGALFALNRKDGHVMNQFYPGAGIMAAPVLDEKMANVFLYSNQANLYKLRLDWYLPHKDALVWKE